MHAAFLLVAASCLTASQPGLEGWDGSPFFDPSVAPCAATFADPSVVPCSETYFDPSVAPCAEVYLDPSFAPCGWHRNAGYDSGGWGGDFGWNPGWGGGGWDPWCGGGSGYTGYCPQQKCEKHGCFARWREKHRRCEDDCAPSWGGWDNGDCCQDSGCERRGCFARWREKHRHQDDCAPSCCGYASVYAACQASGTWCPDDCGRKDRCTGWAFFGGRRHHHKDHAPCYPLCYEPCDCLWECDCDCQDCLGGPPVAAPQAKPAPKGEPIPGPKK